MHNQQLRVVPTFAQADDAAVVWPVIDEDHRVLFVMSDSIPSVAGGCVAVGRPLWSGENAGNGQEENAEESAGCGSTYLLSFRFVHTLLVSTSIATRTSS